MRGRRVGLALGSVALVTACEIGSTTVAPPQSTVVVHAVLNASSATQIVLVERTLTGAAPVHSNNFIDPNNPIVTDGGIPEDGAIVTITTPAGQVVTGPESGHTGMYRVPLNGASLVGGAVYRLDIRTVDGTRLSAETRLPKAAAPTTSALVTFDRSRDTVRVEWPASENARTYGIRVPTPYGPFLMFTDSTFVRFTGDLRNLFSEGLPRVFFPGFVQTVEVVAVDANFYDYYRTHADPFTGSGIISRVKGGLGLFGSTIVLATRTFSVTAPQRAPIEGTFVLRSGPALSVPDSMTLYVESKSKIPDQPDALSGSYRSRALTGRALLGLQLGDTVEVDFLSASQLADQVPASFTGVLRGDTLTGTYTQAGQVGPMQFVRRP